MKKLLILFAALAMILSACSNTVNTNGNSSNGDTSKSKSNSGNSKKGGPIVIGGKPWTEQRILPYILADYIQAKTNYSVKVRNDVGETNVLQAAITQGKIDMYVEYTGTGYLAVLKHKFKSSQTAQEIYQTTKKEYQKKYNLTWTAPLGFQNTYAITVRKSTAKKYNLKKSSDITKYSNKLIFGGPATFYGRSDGFKYMKDSYNYQFKKHVSLKPGLMYEAVKKGQVDVIPAFTTDARIDLYNLAMTKDDKHIFPPYYAAPVVRMDTLKSHPKLKGVLNSLKGKISVKEMRHMNGEVDIHHKKPEDVAKKFLKDKGLIN